MKQSGSDSPRLLSERFQFFQRRLKRRWSSLSEYLGTRPAKIVGLLLTVTLITTLTSGYSFFSIESKISGGIVRSDLIAPEDFVLVDQLATAERQAEAISQVPPVFEYDPLLKNQIRSRIISAFDKDRMTLFDRLKVELGEADLTPALASSPKFNAFAKKLAAETPTPFTLSSDPQVLEYLVRQGFSDDIEKELNQLLSMAMKDFIYPDTDMAKAQPRRLMYQDKITQTQHEIRGRNAVSVSAALNQVKEGVDSLRSLSSTGKEVYLKLLQGLLQPNLRYSEALTEGMRKKAVQSIPDVSTAYRRNQIIARAGDPVTPHIQAVVSHLSQKQQYHHPLRRFIGLFGIITILLFALYKFTAHARSDLPLPTDRAFALICVTLVAQTMLIWLGINISRKFGGTAGMSTDLSLYEFAIPYAAATLIVALLLDENLALLCTLVVGLLAGVMTGGSMELCVFAILSGSAAAYSVGQYRQRNTIIRAGVFVGGINLFAVGAVICIAGSSTMLNNTLLTMLLCGIASGLITAAFASFAVPVCESMFGILTDVKLLELSNADLPLLRELAMRAPGTQQHSVMVSSLAQEAAEAIGANALLVRIGCYYHDIGKLLAPEMFIENQGGGPNPHDKMEPRRSASVITGHVRKGIIMAREANLPKEIIDLIPQHHGTRKLHYFFNKASERAATRGESVDETDYRYPGPKPQTKEAAIVMMADSAEAAARSLDEPTPENIGQIVKRILDDIIADGQLDECLMTMREITLVREQLVRTLCNIYHHRVVYPGFNSSCADSEEVGLCLMTSDETERIEPIEVEFSPEPELTPEPANISTAARIPSRLKTGEVPPIQGITRA